MLNNLISEVLECTILAVLQLRRSTTYNNNVPGVELELVTTRYPPPNFITRKLDRTLSSSCRNANCKAPRTEENND